MGMDTNKLTSLHGNNRECGAQEVNIIVSRDLTWTGLAKKKLLKNERPNEEQAVFHISSFYNDMSDDVIKHSWRETGLKKFKHLRANDSIEVDSEQIQNELNQRLEEAVFFLRIKLPKIYPSPEF